MKEYIHYNRFSDIRGLESAVNSFEHQYPITLPPNSNYHKLSWKCVTGYPKMELDNNGNLSKMIFKFENKSNGTYTARPWKVSVGRTADGKEIFSRYDSDLNVPAYKVIPKTQINVGCIPMMRLVSRRITPRDNGVGGLNMRDVEVIPVHTKSLTGHNNRQWAINKIKEHYSTDKGITSLYIGNGKRLYSKNGVKPIVNYHGEHMKQLFFENAKDAIVDYIRWTLKAQGKDVIIKRKS